MKLSKYNDEIEKKWNNDEQINAKEIIEYLNSKIDKDLYEMAKTENPVEVYTYLHIWLLIFHKDALIEGLNKIGISYENFQKQVIYSLILSITRNASNLDYLLDGFKHTQIIEDLFVSPSGNEYKLVTKNFGEIYFEKANKAFESDKETLDYVDKMGDEIKERCHDISFYLIKKYKSFKAVTGVMTTSLNKKFLHSFVLDEDDYVIDFTANLIIPKGNFYKLNNIEMLNTLNYEEYLKEKEESIDYDESKTLCELLRCALYKKCSNKNEFKKN